VTRDRRRVLTGEFARFGVDALVRVAVASRFGILVYMFNPVRADLIEAAEEWPYTGGTLAETSRGGPRGDSPDRERKN
jgi:hypothetical protein